MASAAEKKEYARRAEKKVQRKIKELAESVKRIKREKAAREFFMSKVKGVPSGVRRTVVEALLGLIDHEHTENEGLETSEETMECAQEMAKILVEDGKRVEPLVFESEDE